MDADHLSALRQAASALLNTAAAPVVLAALQVLLADPAFAADAPALPLQPAPPARRPIDSIAPSPAPTPPLPAPRAPPPRQREAAAPTVVDAGWDELRRGVKAKMTERGVSYADVGAAIGRSEIATRIAVNTRKPARPIVRSRLEEWLANGAAGAPEVAAHGMTFPGNGASRVHSDNGSGFGTAD